MNALSAAMIDVSRLRGMPRAARRISGKSRLWKTRCVSRMIIITENSATGMNRRSAARA